MVAEQDDPAESPSEEVVPDASESPSEETPGAKAEGEETPSDATDAEEDPEFVKAVSKHKGDKAAFAKHYWSVQNQNAKMAAELKALKAKLETPSTKPQPAQQETAPDLKAIDSEIGALASERDQLPVRFEELRKEYDTAKTDVIKLTDELERSDELDKRAVRAELRAAKADVQRLEQEAKILKRDYANYNKEIVAKQSERKAVERWLNDRARQQEEQETERARIAEEFPQEVNGLADQAIAAATKLQVDGATRSLVQESVRNAVAVHLWRNQGVPIDQTGFEKVVQKVVGDWAKTFEKGGKTALLDASKRRTPTQRPVAKPGQPAPKGEEYDPMKAARERLVARGL